MNVVLVHGFMGHPENVWFPWLRTQLAARGDSVVVPAMPDPAFPRKHAWVDALRAVCSDPARTVLVGHSLGCAAILSMLQEHTGDPFAQVVFVAGFGRDFLSGGRVLPWFTGWFDTPLDFSALRTQATRWTSIFSTDDPLVPPVESRWLAEQLESEQCVEPGKGHFRRRDGVRELPSVLNAIHPTSSRVDVL